MRAVPGNTVLCSLMQLSPAARVGLLIFLLALAMVATGLGVRSVTKNLSPARHTGPRLMVYEAPMSPPASVNPDRAYYRTPGGYSSGT